MLYYKNQDDTIGLTWKGEPIDGVRHPKAVEKLWSDAELAAVGLYKKVVNTVDNSTTVNTKTEISDPVFDGEKFVVTETVSDQTTEEIKDSLPALTPRQLRLGLLAAGYNDTAIRAKLNTIVEPELREAALIEWEFAGAFLRTNPILIAVAASLGLSDDDINVLWINAMEL